MEEEKAPGGVANPFVRREWMAEYGIFATNQRIIGGRSYGVLFAGLVCAGALVISLILPFPFLAIGFFVLFFILRNLVYAVVGREVRHLGYTHLF